MGTCGVEEMRMEAAMADLDRNAIPANADCRGGVFAVFAKIPPPAASALPNQRGVPSRDKDH